MKDLDEIMRRAECTWPGRSNFGGAGGRAIDDALDAAGAPHHNDLGSLTTVQRIEALGKLAQATTAASASVLGRPAPTDAVQQPEERPPLGTKPRWLHDSMRMADLAEAIARFVRRGNGSRDRHDVVDEWAAELFDISRRGGWRRPVIGGGIVAMPRGEVLL